MVLRDIVVIDEEKCNGCALCVPNCYEGALQIIDGKARLISDIFCDGLGNCVGHCPQDAITIEKKEAESYDEIKVISLIVKQGINVVNAHLKHLADHNETQYLKQAISYLKENNIEFGFEDKKDDIPCGCPGTMMREVKNDEEVVLSNNKSALRQWPVQLMLLPPQAPFFNNSHLLVAADCVGFANPNFHSELLFGKSVVIGCPKLDNLEHYTQKLTEIFKLNNIKSVTVAIMEVPCCAGMYYSVEEAIKESGKNIPLIKEVVSVEGKIN